MIKNKACVETSVIGYKLDIKLHFIEYFRGGGGFFAPFVHVDRGGGYVEYPRLSTWGGVKIGPRSCWMPPYLTISDFMGKIFQAAQLTNETFLTKDQSSKMFLKVLILEK